MAVVKITNQTGRILDAGRYETEIVYVKHDEATGRVSIRFEQIDGTYHYENYYLLKNDGTDNSFAYDRLSLLAIKAFQDDTLEEFDTEDLKGKNVIIELKEYSYNDKNGNARTGLQIGDVEESYEVKKVEKPKQKQTPKAAAPTTTDDGSNSDLPF